MPVAIPFILMGVAAAASIAGGVMAHQAAQQQGRTAEAVANYNAKVQRNRSISISQQAQVEADRLRARNRRMLATQRNQLAKSGALTGSALDLQEDTAVQGELDVLNTIYRGNLGSNESLAAANIEEAQGRAARTQARWQGASALVGGIGGAAGAASSYFGSQAPTIN